MCIHVDDCDSSNNGALIGAIVGVDCTVIIIIVITNITVWIYCFRRRHHTGEAYKLISYSYICGYTCSFIYTAVTHE